MLGGKVSSNGITKVVESIQFLGLKPALVPIDGKQIVPGREARSDGGVAGHGANRRFPSARVDLSGSKAGERSPKLRCRAVHRNDSCGYFLSGQGRISIGLEPEGG